VLIFVTCAQAVRKLKVCEWATHILIWIRIDRSSDSEDWGSFFTFSSTSHEKNALTLSLAFTRSSFLANSSSLLFKADRRLMISRLKASFSVCRSCNNLPRCITCNYYRRSEIMSGIIRHSPQMIDTFATHSILRMIKLVQWCHS